MTKKEKKIVLRKIYMDPLGSQFKVVTMWATFSARQVLSPPVFFQDPESSPSDFLVIAGGGTATTFKEINSFVSPPRAALQCGRC